MIRQRVPKYVQVFIDRHGKLRLYLRRSGRKKVPLPGPLWSPAFMQAYEAAIADEQGSPIGASRTRPGTFSALIVEYYASTNYTGLAPTTKATYRRVIENFRREYGEGPVADLKREHVLALVERKTKTPAAANDLLKKLKMLCRFAVERGYRTDDPTSLVRRARTKSGGYRTWSEDDIGKFRATWPLGGKERLAIELLLNTGQRRSDVCLMGPQHVRAGFVSVRQQKTGQHLGIPLHPDLAAAIAATPTGQLAFLVGLHGKPYHPDSFSHWFNKACRAASLEVGLSAHGLRKAMCVRLAEAGCTASQIMSISGHRNIREVETYVAAASQKRLASDAIARLEVSNHAIRLDNSDRKSLKRKE